VERLQKEDSEIQEKKKKILDEEDASKTRIKEHQVRTLS